MRRPRGCRRSGMARRRGPGHVRAELDRGDRRRVELGDDPAAQHHEQPVGQADQLLEVGRDEQRGQAGRTGRRAGCPRSPPGRRRRRRASGGRRAAPSGSLVISRPTISFCWLPPESVNAGTSMPGVRTSNSVTICVGPIADRAAVDEPALDERGAALVAEQHVLPQRERQHHAVALAVLGDVADAGLAGGRASPACRGPGRRAARSRSASRSPMIASTSSVCPLPSTPAMPTISPACTSNDTSVERPAARCRHRRLGLRRRLRHHRLAGRVALRQLVDGDLAAVATDGEVAHLEQHLGSAPSSRGSPATAARCRPSSRRAAAAVTVDGSSTSPTVRPARITVIASALPSTSSSLWEMKITVEPCVGEVAQRARTARRPRAARAPRSARRGSGCGRRGRAP